MTKVSVIIPVYNVEKYLAQCLESVIAQEPEDMEIICVNDGSTDSCPEILKQYAQKDSRITIISQANAGYGAAVNAGLDAAKGEYVGIVESDDWAEPNMFQELYALAEEHQLDIIKADYYKYWSNGKNKLVKIGRDSEYNHVYALSPQEYQGKIWGSIWSALYRREFLNAQKIRLLPTPGASYQDTSFIFKTNICARRIMLVNKAYLHYRQDNECSSVKNKSKIFCLCDEYDEIDEFLIRQKMQQWQTMADIRRLEGCFWNLNRLSPKNRPLFIEKVKVFMLAMLNKAKVGGLHLHPKKIRRLELLERSEKMFCLKMRIHDLCKFLRSLV